MDIFAGIQASLAGRYASALFDLASEHGSVSAVESDLEKLNAALNESSDLQGATTNPELSRQAQGAAIAAVADHLGVSDLTKNFLGVLANNRRLSALGDMISAFQTIGRRGMRRPQLLAGDIGDSPVGSWLFYVGLLATLVLTIVITRIAGKELGEQLDEAS